MILGEARLPGPPPAVSSYLSAKAHERLERARAQQSEPLPVPQPAPIASITVPQLDAIAAQRALREHVPRGTDASREQRYREYLAAQAEQVPFDPQPQPQQTLGALQQELDEFHQAASIFKPLSGAMADRFTTATSDASAKDKVAATPVLSTAQQAAREGNFGALTRSTTTFVPPRLLCKRLGIPPPRVDDAPPQEAAAGGSDTGDARDAEATQTESAGTPLSDSDETASALAERAAQPADVEVEQDKPSLDLFKAVFESDEEDAAQDTLALQFKRPSKDTASAKPKAKKRSRVGPLTFDLDDEDGA